MVGKSKGAIFSLEKGTEASSVEHLGLYQGCLIRVFKQQFSSLKVFFLEIRVKKCVKICVILFKN